MTATLIIWALIVGTPHGHVQLFGYRSKAACDTAFAHLPIRDYRSFPPECVRVPVYTSAGNPILEDHP